MSSETVISVEELGKCYSLNHLSENRRYTTFREAITKKVRGLLDSRRRFLQPPTEEDFWALKSVNFEVRRGEVLGIVGRNGAGKSTLLKVLSRITEPSEGRVRIKGRVASLLEVGTGFHSELTGRQNIFLNGSILGMSRVEIRRKFDEIVAFAGVNKFLDTPVKHYSSGMYVRLAFAVAAHLEPEILIIDEVLAVGDAEFQRKCLGKMQDVAKAGRTVLFVSHQLGALQDLCSSGLLLKGGRATSFEQIEPTIGEYLNSLNQGVGQADWNTHHLEAVRVGSTVKAVGYVFYGEALVIVVSLRNNSPHEIGLNLSVRNESGRLITFFSTNPQDGFRVPTVAATKIAFTMNFCAYAPGKYSVDVAVTEPNIRVIEQVPNAATFEVLPKSIGGHSPYESRFGDVFPQHSWQVWD